MYQQKIKVKSIRIIKISTNKYLILIKNAIIYKNITFYRLMEI
jgi:hypothetical protein